MTPTDERLLSSLRLLLSSSHLTGPDQLPDLVSRAARELGAEAAALWLVDYDLTQLVRLAPRQAAGGLDAAVLRIEGTLAGRAFTRLEQHVATSAEGRQTLWTPVQNGTERLGVLQLELSAGEVVTEELTAAVLHLTGLVAELVMTRSQYGDLVEQTRRQGLMTLPAELQWQQLRPLTFVTPSVALAAGLVPSLEVAGDSFDYALNDGVLHVALLDAMGHGLEAALLACVAIGALRNARRRGLPLGSTAVEVETALAAQFGPDRFVTAIIGELTLETGHWRWRTFGHPPALLVRDGRVVRRLDAPVEAPLGLGLLDAEAEAGEERLEPGDRLLLYTDGVVEARNGDGEFFGTERLVDLTVRQHADSRPAAETLRRLVHAVLDHQGGALQDDATTLLVEWQAEPGRRDVANPRA
jgi:hypothetical protein